MLHKVNGVDSKENIFVKNGNLELYWDAKDLREKEGKSIDELFREVYRW